MIQKISWSLSTNIYDMVKVLAIFIEIATVFAIYETIFENTLTTLPITYQNKTKINGKNRKSLICL